MTTYTTIEQLMDDILNNLCDAADAAATPKEREASKHGVETMEFICNVVEEMLIDAFENGRVEKLSRKKGLTGYLYGGFADYVNEVRDKARVEVLAEILDATTSDINSASASATDAMLEILDAPRGSITSTFKDEEYAQAIVDALAAMTYTVVTLHQVEHLSAEKVIEANA